MKSCPNCNFLILDCRYSRYVRHCFHQKILRNSRRRPRVYWPMKSAIFRALRELGLMEAT